MIGKLQSVAALAALLVAQAASAQAISPVGLWRTLDDRSGRPRALVRITERGGIFEGRIERLFLEPQEPPDPRCKDCEGDLKGRPILGLTIVTAMRRDAEAFSGGRILDPENGQRYRATMTLAPDGRQLIVRGYIGLPLLGRSQVWLREP